MCCEEIEFTSYFAFKVEICLNDYHEIYMYIYNQDVLFERVVSL